MVVGEPLCEGRYWDMKGERLSWKGVERVALFDEVGQWSSYSWGKGVAF